MAVVRSVACQCERNAMVRTSAEKGSNLLVRNIVTILKIMVRSIARAHVARITPLAMIINFN